MIMEDTRTDVTQQSKRSFLRYILAGGVLAWLASVFYPIFAYLVPPKQREVEVTSVKAGKASDVPDNSGQIVKFGTQPVILIRTPGGDLRAFSAVCTHLGCTVQYRSDQELIWCACHNGKYDLHGRNISGPPPRPLTPYRVVVQGGVVTISKET
jgi:cytochrome b6-f complex iron-sulfur subunit